jgi:S1-C subfamily serine protease
VALVVLALVATVALGVGRGHGRSEALSLTEPLESPYAVQRDVAPAAPVRGPLSATEVSALARKVSPALVDVNVQLGLQGAQGAGTGIVLTSSGEVLTNNHVINGATAIRVTSIGNGRTYPASVVGYDRTHDIAVLQIRGASGLSAAPLGNSDDVTVGDPITAIGNAGGVGGTPTSVSGSVVALDRSISTRDELSGSTEQLNGLIEVAANIEPGDSGGPLVNADGQVVGVNTAASVNFKTQTPGGKGYAIPINDAMRVVRQIRGGTASDAVHIGSTAMLGVTVLSNSNAAFPPGSLDGSNPNPGATVARVLAGSPAESAGLSQGDVIVSFDGSRVDSANTLTALIGQHRPGDQVPLVWLDGSGDQQNATIQLAAGPPG